MIIFIFIQNSFYNPSKTEKNSSRGPSNTTSRYFRFRTASIFDLRDEISLLHSVIDALTNASPDEDQERTVDDLELPECHINFSLLGTPLSH